MIKELIKTHKFCNACGKDLEEMTQGMNWHDGSVPTKLPSTWVCNNLDCIDCSAITKGLSMDFGKDKQDD